MSRNRIERPREKRQERLKARKENYPDVKLDPMIGSKTAGSRPPEKRKQKCPVCKGQKRLGYWKTELAGRFRVPQKRWAYRKCSTCGGSGRI